MDRREFLRLSARAGAGAVALASGACSKEPDGAPQADLGADMASDLGRDLGVDLGVDAGVDMAAAVAEVSKRPFVHLRGEGEALLRFETPVEQALEVEIVHNGQSVLHMPTRSTQEVPYAWPELPGLIDRTIPDEPGFYTMHDLLLEGLTPGERYTWRVGLGGGESIEGSFRVAPPKGGEARVGWISDTMLENAEGPIARLQGFDPELMLHGGDIQYTTALLDTWAGAFHRFAPLMARAPMHFCIGNHEYETPGGADEFSLQYQRLLGKQRAQGDMRYHGVTCAGVRFLMLNSEEDFDDLSGPQLSWLKAELEAVRQSPELHFAVVAYHRPFFTMSSSSPDFARRDKLHPLFQEYGVPLVLNGHNHCYERFEADGITYIMDGGGGAALYETDEHREDVLAERPGDDALRKFAHKSFGGYAMRIMSDGTIRGERLEAGGEGALDRFEVGVEA